MHILNPSPPSSSSDHVKCLEDTCVVPTTTPLPVWSRKTLESVGFEIGIPSDTRQTKYGFLLMTKVFAINNSSTYAQAKDKLEWEKAMTTEYNLVMKNKTWNLVPLTH